MQLFADNVNLGVGLTGPDKNTLGTVVALNSLVVFPYLVREILHQSFGAARPFFLVSEGKTDEFA